MILRGPPLPAPRWPTLVHALEAAAREPSGVTFVGLDERETFLPWGEVLRRAARAGAALAGAGAWRPATGWPSSSAPSRPSSTPSSAPGGAGRSRCRSTRRCGSGGWTSTWPPRPACSRVSGARLVVSAGGTRRLLGPARWQRARPPLGCVDADRLRAGAAGSGPRPPRRPTTWPWSSSPPARRWTRSRWPSPTARCGPWPTRWSPRPARTGAATRWSRGCRSTTTWGSSAACSAAATYPGPLVLIAPEHFLARPALWPRAVAPPPRQHLRRAQLRLRLRRRPGSPRRPRRPLARAPGASR